MISDNIKKKIEKEIDKKINFKKTFDQNQLDSLDIITLISICEEEYKIKVSEQKLKKIKNFLDLEKLISNS